MKLVAAILHVYLIVRIVACPCLWGGRFHDAATRALFTYAGAAGVPDDDLADPSRSGQQETCMCDGADAPSCPVLPPPDLDGQPLVDLDELDAPSLLEVVEPTADDFPDPPRGPDPIDAGTLRAQLQNFRC